MAWFLLFLLVLAAVIGYFFWDFRRKTAAREAASSKRFAEMMRAPAAAPARPEPSSAAAPTPSPAPAPQEPAGAKVPGAVTTRPATERFLGQAQTLLYYLLKTGVPELEVFANVSLASVVGASGSGSEREQQLRRLAQYQLDFVVCDKSMRVIAAVEMESAGGAEAAGAQRFRADCLKEAGIRLVRVSPAAPPKRDQIRSLVRGEPVKS